MKPGVATALIKNSDISGRFKREYLILEIDERSLEQVTEDLKPGHLCVTNIQKDQVLRNGDPDYIYQKVKRAVSGADGLCLYVNNEEPRSKSLEDFIDEGGKVIRFGVQRNERSSQTEEYYGVTMPCPLCHDALVFTHMNLSGVGHFHCPSCGFASEQNPDLKITDVDYENETFRAFGENKNLSIEGLRLAYPAAFFLYNYALCTCIAFEFLLEEDTLKKAFDTFINIGGRMESFSHAGKRITYMRVKQENPETLQNALDTIANDKKEKVFVAGPDIVSDIVPWYSNTFYTFDCNFEPLVNSGIEKYICFGSIVCWDMANRLRYAGVPEEMIEILDTDEEEKILAAIAGVKTDNIYLITLLKKYEQLKDRAG
jgi:UDP-N-acetylmuramyl tripeptide synthase